MTYEITRYNLHMENIKEKNKVKTFEKYITKSDKKKEKPKPKHYLTPEARKDLDQIFWID